MNAEWLLNWWNLIFLLPFALALVYLGLYTASGITFGDGDLGADGDLDADADADVDHDLDADHDLDTDHDADADHDADSDHDAETEGEHESQVSPHLAAITWLGVGRVPVSVLLMVLFLTWGAVGFVINAALERRGAAAALISVPGAAVAGLLVTHFVAVLIARYLPLYETTARRRHELLGSIGEAVLPIDQRFGMVCVRDDTGDLYQLPCRMNSEGDPVPKGSKVQLVSYHAKQGLFYVTRHDTKSSAALT